MTNAITHIITNAISDTPNPSAQSMTASQVNLLPWREVQREQLRHQLLARLLVAGLVVMVCQYCAGWFLSLEFANQQKMIVKKEKHIQKLENDYHDLQVREQQYNKLEKQIALIAQLQNDSNQATHIMNQLPQVIPALVSLSKIKMVLGRINMSGISANTQAIVQLLDNLENSPLFYNVDLYSVVHGNARSRSSHQTFSIAFDINTAHHPVNKRKEVMADD
ncbi:hypothetical protein BCU68_02570 [Vibrio sp. 10N.286.49.B3]|uniref:PilN domain-containing protein n=1 Tax=Vibrio sp. 10N.286.49.B3 TaxID=1880855 RepID=UPI000C845DD7|nr:PilN domain-containing protein [Vibrio sp. 10N.286.49.B3]PMH46280.1 hypothetical protein BCU68_02570 [Vibrio sp. 10N.286.49.B3]